MAYYEDIIIDKDKCECKLCSIPIEDSSKLIEAHINSDTHKELEVRRCLLQNSMVIIDSHFYCFICNKSLDRYELKDHLQSSTHVSSKEKVEFKINADGGFLKLPYDPTEEVNHKEAQIKCVLCDYHIKFTLESVSYHINTDKHRRAKAIAVQPLNGILSVENCDTDLWCKFCRQYFENYMEFIFEHVNNKEHKTKITKILNLIKDEYITIEEFLMDPKEDKARCLKCDTMVACNVDNLERHIKGKQHTNQKNKGI